MPKKTTKEVIEGKYYRWILGQRNGVYYADGRTNTPDLGRQSLGTKVYEQACEAIHGLDLAKAVECGVVDSSLLQHQSNSLLSLEEGRKLYETYAQRPRVAGGPRETTRKRYRPVFNKFLPFAQRNRIATWNQVNRNVLDGYASWLDGESYAYATEYLELSTIKQVLKYLIANGHLPVDCQFKYPLKKPDGTNTYCYLPEEVKAMIDHCDRDELRWLRNIIIALASTGLRISELASLRWSDLDHNFQMVRLTDESQKRQRGGRKARTTKTGASRSFPVHLELKAVLESMERHSDGLVFHGPLGGKVKADTIRRILIRDVLEPLASEFPSEPDEEGLIDGRLHSFRHYFCSTCANSGVSEHVLKNWLGHKSSRMVHRYYHLHGEESRRQMEKVNIVMMSTASA